MEMLRFQSCSLDWKTVLQFFEKIFVFRKICLKVKLLKTFKIFSDCRIKACRSFKWSAILKIPSIVFQKNLYALYVEFKIKPLKRAFLGVKTKINWNFAVSHAEMLKEATIHFCLFDEPHFSNIFTLLCDNRMYRN